MIKYKAIKINQKNAPIIADIVYETYRTFNDKEGDKKSMNNYLSQYDTNICSAEELNERFKKLTINFSAFSGDKMIGVIRGRDNKIINLFVNKNFHNQGVGKKLINLFEARAKKNNSKFIKIRSSLYAAKFYSKLGYKKTTGIRLFHGLKVQPMKKEL